MVRRFKYVPKPGEAGIGIKGTIHYGICNEATCSSEERLVQLGQPKRGRRVAQTASRRWRQGERGKRGFRGDHLVLSGRGLYRWIDPECDAVRATRVGDQNPQLRAASRREPIADFTLNVSYTVGVLAVFLRWRRWPSARSSDCPSSGDFSWGGLFQHTRFNLVMAGVCLGWA